MKESLRATHTDDSLAWGAWLQAEDPNRNPGPTNSRPFGQGDESPVMDTAIPNDPTSIAVERLSSKGTEYSQRSHTDSRLNEGKSSKRSGRKGGREGRHGKGMRAGSRDAVYLPKQTCDATFVMASKSEKTNNPNAGVLNKKAQSKVSKSSSKPGLVIGSGSSRGPCPPSKVPVNKNDDGTSKALSE
jgi:hypothetical protein